MPCLRIKGEDGVPDGFLCVGGPTHYIDVGRQSYQFELPYGCGLVPLNKDLSARMTPWPRAVWDAVDLWSKGGERVDEDGVCVWGCNRVGISKERLMKKRPRGVCRIHREEGQPAQRVRIYTCSCSCGCCGAIKSLCVDGIGEDRPDPGVQGMRDAAIRAGYIFTSRFGWVCPRVSCQTVDVLAEWRRVEGRSFMMRQRVAAASGA
jgi:hypothetical protein